MSNLARHQKTFQPLVIEMDMNQDDIEESELIDDNEDDSGSVKNEEVFRVILVLTNRSRHGVVNEGVGMVKPK